GDGRGHDRVPHRGHRGARRAGHRLRRRLPCDPLRGRAGRAGLRAAGRRCRSLRGRGGDRRRARGRSAGGPLPYVTGPAGFSADLAEGFAGIDGLLLAVALAAVLVILLIVYRSVLLPLIVLCTSLFALCAALLTI